ncbi:RHS repeat-associated core domain-containing protein [Chryseobacterium sp. 22458]|uniref:RHS repeat-associated core domain-containing protein n=1 Tax=Chryseobacterium sp. 22458 TaxID=3453921 RepID=UPI003F8350F7
MTQARRSLFGSYYSYKYNGKELQETGMYDYGARMMMPDLGRWGVMDAMSEKYSSWSPYNYAINNPVMVIDPDGNDAMFASGEAAQIAFKAYVATMSTSTESSGGNIFTGFEANPLDDHFNQFGKFLYTDNKKTNNIVIDFQNPITGKLNTAPWLSIQLKDYIFNKDNAFVLANIANHYAKDAGINLNSLRGNSMSVGVADYHFEAGKIVGTFFPFNGGDYNPDALMQANKRSKTVSLMVGNGKAHPYYNDKNNMISALSHEGGEISHLTVNPDNINISKLDLAKEHIKIYEYQMSSPLFKKTTPEFQQLMKKNYSNDKWYYNTYKPK